MVVVVDIVVVGEVVVDSVVGVVVVLVVVVVVIVCVVVCTGIQPSVSGQSPHSPWNGGPQIVIPLTSTLVAHHAIPNQLPSVVQLL